MYIEKLPTIGFLQITNEYHSIFETSKVVCGEIASSIKKIVYSAFFFVSSKELTGLIFVLRSSAL